MKEKRSLDNIVGKKLERIFWKGKWVNSFGKKVNPVPIGEPKTFRIYGKEPHEEKESLQETEEDVKMYELFDAHRNEINAYEIGVEILNTRLVPLQFYKI